MIRGDVFDGSLTEDEEVRANLVAAVRFFEDQLARRRKRGMGDLLIMMAEKRLEDATRELDEFDHAADP